MPQVYLIYMHVCPEGKAYIGQTCDYSTRSGEHKNGNKRTVFAKAVKKFGWDNFKHEILKDGLTREEANHWEKFYILHFKTLHPNGYNLRSGGHSPTLHESSKKKIGDANRGRVKSAETIEKLRIGSTGRRHTEEHKQYMREKLKGRKFSPETIQKMSDAAKKRNSNPEFMAKIAKTLFKKGQKPSTATRKAVSAATKLRWKKFRESKQCQP